jgi:hypothetical protein
MSDPSSMRLSHAVPLVKQLLAMSFPAYKGRKVNATLLAGPISLDLNWSGGSRDQAVMIDLASGTRKPLRAPSPFERAGHEPFMPPPGVILAVHSIFCGKDAGVTFYVRAGSEDARKLMGS